MTEPEVLYITFKIDIANTQHSWNGRSVETEMQITVPRNVYHAIDAGNLFNVLKDAALLKFDEPEEEEK